MSEYDISYVHNSNIQLVQLNICTKKPKFDHYFEKIQATRYFLHILAQVIPEFTEKSGMTFSKKGHIERLKFTGTEINQHSGKT